MFSIREAEEYAKQKPKILHEVYQIVQTNKQTKRTLLIKNPTFIPKR